MFQNINAEKQARLVSVVTLLSGFIQLKSKLYPSDMETLKSYLVWPMLPTLRLPTLAQLKEGSFLNPRVDPLQTEESWLKDFEVN